MTTRRLRAILQQGRLAIAAEGGGPVRVSTRAGESRWAPSFGGCRRYPPVFSVTRRDAPESKAQAAGGRPLEIDRDVSWHAGGMEAFRDQELRDALVEAESPLWSVRAAAGRRLAVVPQIEAVADALRRLLLDAQDTGVTSDTAVALLARRDLPRLRAVLAALAVSTGQGTADQLSAELDGDPRWITGNGVAELIRQLQTLTSDADPEVRDEAQRRLSHLRCWKGGHRHGPPGCDSAADLR